MARNQNHMELMKELLETTQDIYDAMVNITPAPERMTVMDYVNDKLATSHVPGELDGFGRRVQELYTQVHGAAPTKERRFCGTRIKPTNVYTRDDLFLLDHAWSEQELAWKTQQVRHDAALIMRAIRDENL